MDRADRAGLSVAVAGHVVLFGALSFGFANLTPPKPVPPPAMKVEFVDTVALEPAAAEHVAELRSAEVPEVGPIEEAMPQPAPEPEPLPPSPAPEPLPAPPPPPPAPSPVLKPTPKPTPPKLVKKVAPKPQPATPNPAPVKKIAAPAPAAKPVPPKAAPAKPAPAKVADLAPTKAHPVDRRTTPAAASAKTKPVAVIAAETKRARPAPTRAEPAAAVARGAGKPPTTSANRAPTRRVAASAPAGSARSEWGSSPRPVAAREKPARAPRLTRDLLAGLTDTPEAKPAASATPSTPTMSADAMAGIQAAIKRQVQPCANRQINPGPGANRIGVRLNLRLNKDGSLAAAPQVVSTTGVDDENSRYEERVADLAVATFVGCAPLAGLPDELYRTPKGGWSNFIMNYRLPA